MNTAELRRRNALAAVGRLRNLPALSESAGRLLTAIGRNHIDIAVLVDIIGRDPVIAARVLKVANSPYYGFERQIDSVHRAVVVLGLDVVRNIAVASSLDAMFRGGRITATFHLRELWQHSLAVGVMAETLATQSACAHQPQAFLAGLLHELGWVVHLRSDPRALATLVGDCEQARLPSIAAVQDAEVELFGASHDELGGALLDHWRLPVTLCEAVVGHHRPGERAHVDSPDATLTDLVHAADELTRLMGWGTCLEPYPIYDGAVSAHDTAVIAGARDRLAAMDIVSTPVLQKEPVPL